MDLSKILDTKNFKFLLQIITYYIGFVPFSRQRWQIVSFFYRKAKTSEINRCLIWNDELIYNILYII